MLEDVVSNKQTRHHSMAVEYFSFSKKSRDVRLCFYLRQVDQATDKYPIPTIEELVPEFNRGILFNKMDLRQGIYFQILLVDDCKNITVSSSQEGVNPFPSVQSR